MTSVRVLQNLNRLIWGNAKERRYMRHRIALALRGIDISGAELEDLGLNEGRSFAHTCSSDPDLREVFDTFRISPADAALDAGCGKGAALLTMATYPFGRVDGVEISPVLVQIARRNLQRAGIRKATVFCSDASEFRELDPYTFIYLYNPFPEVVVQALLDNIRTSLKRVPRKLTLIYNHPVFHGLVVSKGFRQVNELTPTTSPVRIYELPGIP